MDFSKLLFWGGIFGMIGTIVTGIVVLLVAIIQKRKLQKNLDAEYGKEK